MRKICLSLLVGLFCVGCFESPIDPVSPDDAYSSFSSHSTCPQDIIDACCGTMYTCACEPIVYSVALMDSIYGRHPHPEQETWGEELWEDPEFTLGEICLDGAEGADVAIGSEEAYYLDEAGMCEHDYGAHVVDASGERNTMFIRRGSQFSTADRMRTFRHEGWSMKHCAFLTGQQFADCHEHEETPLHEDTDEICYENHPWES